MKGISSRSVYQYFLTDTIIMLGSIAILSIYLLTHAPSAHQSPVISPVVSAHRLMMVDSRQWTGQWIQCIASIDTVQAIGMVDKYIAFREGRLSREDEESYWANLFNSLSSIRPISPINELQENSLSKNSETPSKMILLAQKYVKLSDFGRKFTHLLYYQPGYFDKQNGEQLRERLLRDSPELLEYLTSMARSMPQMEKVLSMPADAKDNEIFNLFNQEGNKAVLPFLYLKSVLDERDNESFENRELIAAIEVSRLGNSLDAEDHLFAHALELKLSNKGYNEQVQDYCAGNNGDEKCTRKYWQKMAEGMANDN